VFELGKDLFDGIEIGAVGRQEDKMGAFGPDGLACRLAGAVNLPTGGRAKTGALFPWRFPLALRGDARFGDLAPRDHRPGTKRPIVG